MSGILTKTMARRLYPTRTYGNYFTLISTPSPTENMCMTMKSWERQIHHGLPVILAFAILGMLALAGGLGYLTYRLYHQKKRSLSHRKDAEKASSGLPTIVPWLAISSPASFSPTDTPRIHANQSLQPHTDHLSPTFMPIHTSLNLVPRSEILNDPARRRGVDEVDLWEKKQNEQEPHRRPAAFWRFPLTRAYPDSPESIKIHSNSPTSTLTMQGTSMSQMNRSESEIITKHDTHPILIPHHHKHDIPNIPSSSRDIRLVRQVLQESKIRNSSSDWLHFSGSKSF
ncbi:hypothetical protein G6F43_000844 [Rhizopus delemar]|nr:hypothetical protein G6F43_000844 [Rhizopus delemar]